jgi:hypothetical protein
MASTNRRDAVPKEIEVTFRCAPQKILGKSYWQNHGEEV